ncbi:MAG TPA: hypothetical protein VK961_21885 [Chthoniobacter sp.]|nr:hypothetical protein [Chthoniobacter sp.]
MDRSLTALRRLIWLYFWLLLFEGAMRKWLFPGLSNALLIVRDPVVLAIYALALRDKVFPANGFILWTFALAVLCFLTSFGGIGTLPVTLYGLRADFLHLPLIFLLPRVLRAEDVRRMGFALLLILLPMTPLAVKQFQAGTNSSWNVGAGGEVGGQLFAAAGKVRASGTFSFATGLATYLALSTAFLLDDLLGMRAYPRWLSIAAVPALALTLGVSGSRTAVISVTIVCSLVLYIAFRRPQQMRGAVQFIVMAIMAVVALVWLAPVFMEGIAVQRERFESGGGVQQGIIVRFGQDFIAAGEALSNAPPLGLGLGVGTNVGAKLLQGQRQFALGEGEWQRVILENGAALGVGYLALRLAITLAVTLAALRAYREGRILPLLLVGAGGLDLATAQFGQPTTLGFAVFTAGLALAATAAPIASGTSPVQRVASEPAMPVIRGRSPYAERLHEGDGKGDAQ